jgi:hypothetical protein
MIDRVLKKRANVEKFIETSIYEISKSKIVSFEDRLTNENWLVLEETHSILESFYKQTIRLQSKRENGIHDSVWEAYPSCEYLLRHILTKKTEYADVFLSNTSETFFESRRHIKISIENCWGKLDNYYQFLNNLPVYIEALILHFGHKLVFIERLWAGKRTWLENTRKNVKKLWETGWKGKYSFQELISAVEETINALISAIINHERNLDPFETFMNSPNLYTAQQPILIDEYKKHLEIPVTKTDKPFEYWKKRYGQ